MGRNLPAEDREVCLEDLKCMARPELLRLHHKLNAGRCNGTSHPLCFVPDVKTGAPHFAR